MPSPALIARLTPVLLVDRIAPCLPFWTGQLGFELTVQVPGPDYGMEELSLPEPGGTVVTFAMRLPEAPPPP